MELSNLVEALIFAAAEPITYARIRKVFERYAAEKSEEEREALFAELPEAIEFLKQRWQQETRGFELVEVAEGLTFRTKAEHADLLRAMREDKPFKLSRSAMETLAIIAYKQPVTKPEADFIRGVDCGGTLKVLLDRNLIHIVGRKEEAVGRPLLYGTTKDFLSVFNLLGLAQLPSMRDIKELTEEMPEEIKATLNLKELSEAAKALRFSEEPMVEELDKAVEFLQSTAARTEQALIQEGIQVAAAANATE